MTAYLNDDHRKVTTKRLKEMKAGGRKIAMLTSYDYTTARIVDGAGIDIILVGDSASNVMAGNVTTLPITVDQMIYHAGLGRLRHAVRFLPSLCRRWRSQRY